MEFCFLSLCPREAPSDLSGITLVFGATAASVVLPEVIWLRSGDGMDTNTCLQRPSDRPGHPGRAKREGQVSVFLPGPPGPLVGPPVPALCLLSSVIIAVLIEGPLDPSLPARRLFQAVSDQRNPSAEKVLLSLHHR